MTKTKSESEYEIWKQKKILEQESSSKKSKIVDNSQAVEDNTYDNHQS